MKRANFVFSIIIGFFLVGELILLNEYGRLKSITVEDGQAGIGMFILTIFQVAIQVLSFILLIVQLTLSTMKQNRSKHLFINILVLVLFLTFTFFVK